LPCIVHSYFVLLVPTLHCWFPRCRCCSIILALHYCFPAPALYCSFMFCVVYSHLALLFPTLLLFYYSCLALLLSCSSFVLFTPTLSYSFPPCVVVTTLHCSLPPYIVVPTLRYYYLLPPCIVVACLGCYDSFWVIIACCCSPYVVNVRLCPMLLLLTLGYHCSPCVACCSPSSCVVVCLKLLMLALG
jgi:hypothetical protein